MMTMDCDVCSRSFGPRRRPLCPSCAQAILYCRRVEQVTALLDREKSHTHAEAIIRPGNDGVLASLPGDADFDAITAGIKSHSLDRVREETIVLDSRVKEILEKAAELKQQIEDYKSGAATQREANEKRRQQLSSRCDELEKHKPRALEPVHATTRKTVRRLDKVRSRITDARLLLCREAAAASNFQRRKGTNGRSDYVLGGITIPDLRELNIKTQPQAKRSTIGTRTVAEPYELVSESLDNVARLLNISAQYLSVRLPAELLLPHEDFPRAVIMPEKSSYRTRQVQFLGVSTSQASSPAASRVLDRNPPRARALWINMPLSQLYKEDPKSFGLYLEGVMLLAFNVAWLCRSQGIDNISTFDDVCAIGRNLWQLLMTQHRRTQRPTMDRRLTLASTKSEAGKETRLGQYSHNSVHSNLAAVDGREIFKEWKLHNSTRLIDKLKSHLIAEISGAEWDLLDEREWDEEREDELPVLVGGTRRPQESRYAAMSVMTVAPPDTLEDDQASTSDSQRKDKGNSGWMKVRGRADAP